MAETNNVDVAAIMNMVAALSPEGSGVRKDVPAESGVSAELERAKDIKRFTFRTNFRF